MVKALFLSVIIAFIFSYKAYSEVVINGTRIVFHAQDKEAVVQLKNTGKNPYLVQMWLDKGDPNARPGEVTVPFVVNPPVVRIDPEKGQAIRLMMTGGQLPQDRETLFWFNLLEVPPKATAMIQSGNNVLQMAFRTRVKLLYRPDKLHPSPVEVYKALRFSLSGDKLTLTNDSPYFITFSKLEIRKSKNSAILARVEHFDQRMVAPEGKIEFILKAVTDHPLYGETLFYSVINDYGGESINEQVLGNNI